MNSIIKDAEEFLDRYIAEIEGSGFVRVASAGIGKKFEYVDSNGYIFAFDLYEQKNSYESGVLMIFAKPSSESYFYLG